MRNPVTQRIVEAVARSKGVDSTELPPLYEAIDPDALNALVTSHSAEQGGRKISVQFTYTGREVIVRSNNDVDVRLPATERDDSFPE